MRRSRVLIAALCFVLALPLQFINFATVGGLGGLWKLVSIALSFVGAALFWIEHRRMKRAANPSASQAPPES